MEEENGTKKLNSTILAASFLMIRFDLVRKLAKLVGLIYITQLLLRRKLYISFSKQPGIWSCKRSQSIHRLL